MVNVRKRNGTTERFDRNKLKESITNAGANNQTASKVAEKVEPMVREGMRTTDIKVQVASELRCMDRGAAENYESFKQEPEMPA